MVSFIFTIAFIAGYSFFHIIQGLTLHDFTFKECKINLWICGSLLLLLQVFSMILKIEPVRVVSFGMSIILITIFLGCYSLYKKFIEEKHSEFQKRLE